MSSIDLKARDMLPAAGSEDGWVILSCVIVAAGIVLALYGFSGSPEAGPTNFEMLTISPQGWGAP